jgi:serine/threonine protein kinase
VINMTDLKERDQERVGTELTLLQNQNHPGLMLIREACILAVPGLWAKAYLLMDFAAGGDLLDRVLSQPDKRLCERESCFYLYQVHDAAVVQVGCALAISSPLPC